MRANAHQTGELILRDNPSALDSSRCVTNSDFFSVFSIMLSAFPLRADVTGSILSDFRYIQVNDRSPASWPDSLAVSSPSANWSPAERGDPSYHRPKQPNVKLK
jgi:hypothetical protein